MSEPLANRKYLRLGQLLFWGCILSFIAATTAVRRCRLSQTEFLCILAVIFTAFVAGMITVRRKIKAQYCRLPLGEQNAIDRQNRKRTRSLVRYFTIYSCLILLTTSWHAISGKTLHHCLLGICVGFLFATPFAFARWSFKRELRRLDEKLLHSETSL